MDKFRGSINLLTKEKILKEIDAGVHKSCIFREDEFLKYFFQPRDSFKNRSYFMNKLESESLFKGRFTHI